MHILHGHSHTAEGDAATSGQLIRWARWYDLMVTLLTFGRAARLRERTADLAGIKTGETVLEVGCGTGQLSQRARRRVGPNGRVHGIDPSGEMIQVARQKAARAGLDIDYRVASIEALPFPDASVDVVLSSLMMHHLPADLKARGLAEVKRVLKPDGRLLIVDMKRPSGLLSHLTLATLIHGHSSHGVQDLPTLTTAAGFETLRSGDVGYLSLGYVLAGVPANEPVASGR
jgi:ubiquinone/menaquinone biosynthesis C-methylase UbiE